MRLRFKQGHVYGTDVRIVDSTRAELPWTGAAFGDLQARGHWVCCAYVTAARRALPTP